MVHIKKKKKPLKEKYQVYPTKANKELYKTW